MCIVEVLTSRQILSGVGNTDHSIWFYRKCERAAMSAVMVTTRTVSNNFCYLRRKTGQLTRIAVIFFSLEFAKF
jgi:hypothetical protein